MSSEVNINPKDSLISIKNKKTGEEKPYLPAHDAVAWFWKDHPAPRGQILTSITDFEQKLVRCEVYVDGTMIASADVKGDGSGLSKAQTNVVRRALAFAGYGTVSAMAYEGDDTIYDESQQARLEMARHKPADKNVQKSMAATGDRRISRQDTKEADKTATISFVRYVVDGSQKYLEFTADPDPELDFLRIRGYGRSTTIKGLLNRAEPRLYKNMRLDDYEGKTETTGWKQLDTQLIVSYAPKGDYCTVTGFGLTDLEYGS
jgi:hypothetical protein